jgi:hypothetical protein
MDGLTKTVNRVENAGNPMWIDEVHRNIELPQMIQHRLPVSAGHTEHQVWVQSENRLQRRVADRADARLLSCFSGILDVVADSDHVVSGAKRKNAVRDAGNKADDTVRVIGYVD